MTALTWGKEQVLETLEKKNNKEAEYSEDSQVSAGNFWKIFTIFLFSAPCLFYVLSEAAQNWLCSVNIFSYYYYCCCCSNNNTLIDM